MDPEVRSRWAATVGPSGPATAAFALLVGRYSEPHRRHHGLAHLERVTADTEQLAIEVGLTDHAPVLAAAFFHDAVYDPRSAANEADSAALADRVLDGLGWPDERRGEVVRLVLATADHAVTDLASAVLLDADLAVLGADAAGYEAYVRGVRSEYDFVTDDAWRVGRAAVLDGFLRRERIFHTEPFRSREVRARANLASELARLGRPHQ